MADYLSILTIAHNSHSPPINDEFPEESLLLVENALFYAYIANYLPIGEVPVEWKAQDKKILLRQNSFLLLGGAIFVQILCGSNH